jgi:transcriptional regulator with XRE-family HTH domain
MAGSGRPVERPAHLSAERRQQAQQRTREWRQACSFSQKQMAAKIHVSEATYRSWENGKGQYAGPTRIQADQLNKTLLGLLPDTYTEGEAFDVWGWPREQDMSYHQVVELLHSTGFAVPRLQANGRAPVSVLWVHKVRPTTLVHGVFSLAAAAITRAGIPVHLLLDDFGLPDNTRRQQCDEFEARVRQWVDFASGIDAKLSTGLYSAILTEEYLVQRGWSAVIDYVDRQSNVLEFLLASKVISPQQYDSDAEEAVLAFLQNHERIHAEQLLTPLRNWLVFEAEVARTVARPSVGTADSVITLGGEDEWILWELWHRGCTDELSSRVQHMFLKPMPTPRRQTWEEHALMARTATKDRLAAYLTKRAAEDGHSDLLEWMLRSAVRLPAALSPGFGDAHPVLAQVDVPLRASGDELSRIVKAVAGAVVEWFTA